MQQDQANQETFDSVKKFIQDNNIKVISPNSDDLGQITAVGRTNVVKLMTYQGKQFVLKEQTNLLHMPTDVWTHMLREIKCLLDCKHDNVIGLYGVVIEDEPTKQLIHLVLEHAKHGTLIDYIKKNYDMPCKDIVRAFLDIAKGLSYLHSKNIIHRDIKPENVLMFDDGRGGIKAKICNFDLSREDTQDNRSMTRVYRGSTLYIAPEMLTFNADATGHFRLTPKLDVYSLGIMLWQAACRKLWPYPSICPDSNLEVQLHYIGTYILAGNRPDTTQVPPQMKDLIPIMEQCWSQDQKERPSAEEIANKLQDILNNLN